MAAPYIHRTETHIKAFLSLCAWLAALTLSGLSMLPGGAEPWTDEKRKPQNRAVKMLREYPGYAGTSRKSLTKSSTIRPQPDLQMAWNLASRTGVEPVSPP